MSFGRRLAFFFLLIVLVPTLALVALLLVVSEDSRRGKADARLAAGLDTALALYAERAADARPEARDLARDPELAAAVAAGDRARLDALLRTAARTPRVTAVELDAVGGNPIAAAGQDDAVAFARLGLQHRGEPMGTLLVSTTTAAQYADQLRRLSKRDLVLSREGTVLTSTVPPPEVSIQPGETEDVSIGDTEFRAHLLSLDGGDQVNLLLLGPSKEGGFLAIGRPAAVLLAGLLALAVALAYALARALTQLHTRVAQQAVTDSLTGLWNRRRMDEILPREVERAIRFKHQLSLVIFDIDDFKAINDREGHLHGDAVLIEVAEVVRETIRSIDFCARYGGDEMALLLLETGSTGATRLAERLGAKVKEAEIPKREGPPTKVTVSVGVATLPDAASDVDSLVYAADRALLSAKRAGKDKIRRARAPKTGSVEGVPPDGGPKTRRNRRGAAT